MHFLFVIYLSFNLVEVIKHFTQQQQSFLFIVLVDENYNFKKSVPTGSGVTHLMRWSVTVMRAYSMIIVAIQPKEITEMVGKESDHRDMPLSDT
jgi:hypothetical protein